MHLKIALGISLAVFSSIASSRPLTESERTVLVRSIDRSSARWDVPVAVMYGLYMQEKGWPGAVIDVGGSADVGVFQFNTSGSNWIPVLNEKFGFSESDLRDYISVSTFSAAYVLSEEYQRTGSWMEAAGNYHRHKKDSARSRYQISVASHIKNFIKQDSRYSNLLANKALSKLAKKSLEERTAGVNFK